MVMSPDERMARIRELKAQIAPLQEELDEVINGCGVESPHQIIKKGSSAYCEVCATHHGWFCPDSPVGVCDYEQPWKPEPGETVTLKEPITPLGYSREVTEFVVDSILDDGRVAASGYLFSVRVDQLVEGEGEYDEDCCRYCGHPDERK